MKIFRIKYFLLSIVFVALQSLHVKVALIRYCHDPVKKAIECKSFEKSWNSDIGPLDFLFYFWMIQIKNLSWLVISAEHHQEDVHQDIATSAVYSAEEVWLWLGNE
jgi:hypothetical protein